jgi:hypothetical protein
VRTFDHANASTPEERALVLSIKKAAMRADDRVAMQFLSALPAKPQDGLYLFAADVTGPGDPRGLYLYDSSTATYTNI